MDRSILHLCFATLVYLALASHANAAPIQGQTPRTQFFLGTAVRSFVKVSRATNGNAERQVVQIPTILSYNLATDAVATLVVPYVIKEFRLRDKTHQDVRDSAVGNQPGIKMRGHITASAIAAKQDDIRLNDAAPKAITIC